MAMDIPSINRILASAITILEQLELLCRQEELSSLLKILFAHRRAIIQLRESTGSELF